MNLKLLTIGLVVFGIWSRLIPHAPNIAAIGAIMLFGGAYANKNSFVPGLI